MKHEIFDIVFMHMTLFSSVMTSFISVTPSIEDWQNIYFCHIIIVFIQFMFVLIPMRGCNAENILELLLYIDCDILNKRFKELFLLSYY